ncbi:hypothetical protein BDZ88DRAFT_455536 [Geranomyces variabilis]|nr:hypothetical protein BDZ88DRAFT_455536 [Geranomyces variabilis]KAJ3131575.1 hypothetical protein HDU90_008174 [Geranomyces variabilis]
MSGGGGPTTPVGIAPPPPPVPSRPRPRNIYDYDSDISSDNSILGDLVRRRRAARRVRRPESAVVTNKGSIANTWRGSQAQFSRLQHFLTVSHRLAQHGSWFLKYWLMQLPTAAIAFPILEVEHIGVALTMLNDPGYAPKAQKLVAIRASMMAHMTQYQGLMAYVHPHARSSGIQNSINFIAQSMLANVAVNIKMHFADNIWRYINLRLHVCDFGRLIGRLRGRTLQFGGRTLDVPTTRAYYRRINMVKVLAMCPYEFYALDPANMDQLSRLEFDVLNEVWGILPPRTLTPDFWQDDKTVDLDAASFPLEYVESYIKLARLFETHGLPLFNALPLRDSHSQSYVTIDSKLLRNAILRKPHLPIKTMAAKTAVWSHCFNLNHSSFHRRGRNAGTHCFDGTVQTDGVDDQGSAQRKGLIKAMYVDHPPNLCRLHDAACNPNVHIMIIDPNVRDRLYMREYQRPDPSDPNANEVRTRPSKKNITLRYTLPQLRKERYLKKFRDCRELLHQTHRDELEECYDDGEFNTMKLMSIRRTMMSEDNLINKMRTTFGNHLMVVMGDWSSSTGGKHKRWHDPQKVTGFRKLFKKHYIPCFLMDKFRTSSFCPTCYSKLESNIVPHRLLASPWQAASGVMVPVHGLLGCRLCARGYRKYKYWNRDMVAVLNLDLKLQGLLKGSGSPALNTLKDTYFRPFPFLMPSHYKTILAFRPPRVYQPTQAARALQTPQASLSSAPHLQLKPLPQRYYARATEIRANRWVAIGGTPVNASATSSSAASKPKA